MRPRKKILTVEIINYTTRTRRVIHLGEDKKNDENSDNLIKKTPIYVDEGTNQSEE